MWANCNGTSNNPNPFLTCLCLWSSDLFTQVTETAWRSLSFFQRDVLKGLWWNFLGLGWDENGCSFGKLPSAMSLLQFIDKYRICLQVSDTFRLCWSTMYADAWAAAQRLSLSGKKDLSLFTCTKAMLDLFIPTKLIFVFLGHFQFIYAWWIPNVCDHSQAKTLR